MVVGFVYRSGGLRLTHAVCTLTVRVACHLKMFSDVSGVPASVSFGPSVDSVISTHNNLTSLTVRLSSSTFVSAQAPILRFVADLLYSLLCCMTNPQQLEVMEFNQWWHLIRTGRLKPEPNIFFSEQWSHNLLLLGTRSQTWNNTPDTLSRNFYKKLYR